MATLDDPINVQQRNIREVIHNCHHMHIFFDRTVQDAMAAFHPAHISRIDEINDDELCVFQTLQLTQHLNQKGFNWDYLREPIEIRRLHFECDIPPASIPRGFPTLDSPDYQQELRHWWAARECLNNCDRHQLSDLEIALYQRQKRNTLKANGFQFSPVRDIVGFEFHHQMASRDIDHYLATRILEDDFRNANPPVLPNRMQEEEHWSDPVNRIINQTMMLSEHKRVWQRDPNHLLPQMWDSNACWSELKTRMEDL